MRRLLRTAVAAEGLPRILLALGMAVAGAGHFARPRPFVAHLPPWLPGREALVAVTGVMELAFAVALIGPRAWRPHVGRALAAFLVAVFPANVYVAVSGAAVPGLPDAAAWRWARLPLQPLLVAWAVWTTGARRGTRLGRRQPVPTTSAETGRRGQEAT